MVLETEICELDLLVMTGCHFSLALSADTVEKRDVRGYPNVSVPISVNTSICDHLYLY